MKHLLVAYTSLCEFLLLYCESVWGGAAKCHLIIRRTQRTIFEVTIKKPYQKVVYEGNS